MHQIYLTQGSFHIAAVASLLQHHIRVVILGLEVIRIMALVGNRRIVDEFELIGKLEKLTKTTCPKALSDTKNKPVRFTGSIKPEEMAEAVLEFINK